MGFSPCCPSRGMLRERESSQTAFINNVHKQRSQTASSSGHGASIDPAALHGSTKLNSSRSGSFTVADPAQG